MHRKPKSALRRAPKSCREVLARYACENLGNREGSADLRLFLAVEEALACAVEPAEEHLHRVALPKAVRRTFGRAGEVFARDGAGWRARLWFRWKPYWHWSPLAFFLLLRALHAVFAAPLR